MTALQDLQKGLFDAFKMEDKSAAVKAKEEMTPADTFKTVSYTHLTLPTNREV